jgi:hypothetical protein
MRARKPACERKTKVHMKLILSETHTRTIAQRAARTLAFAVVVLSGVGASPHDGLAQSTSVSEPNRGARDPIANIVINDDDPESSIPSAEQAMKNPLDMGYFLMALSDRADAAAQRGDHSKEAKYYRAVVKAVPDRSVGYRRACLAHDAAGEWEKALAMCRGALGVGGVTVDDHLKFLKILLKKPGSLTDSQIVDADAVVAGLEGELGLTKDDSGRKVIAEAKCQIGVKLEDPLRLSSCTKTLRELKAEPAKLYTFEWALAISEGDKDGARRVIEAAKQAGLPPAATAAMERGLSKADAVPAQRVFMSTLRRWWPALVATAALALAVFLGFRARRSRPQPA